MKNLLSLISKIHERGNKFITEELKKKTTKEDFTKGYKKLVENRTKMARLGFTVLTVNIAMQILTKRIITPLCATPMASFFKEKFEKAEEKKKAQEEHKVAVNA